MMYQAKVRVKEGNPEYKPVTWGGQQYYASKEQLEMLLSEMRNTFHNNEYIIEEIDAY